MNFEGTAVEESLQQEARMINQSQSGLSMILQFRFRWFATFHLHSIFCKQTFGELVAPLKQLEDLHVYDYNQNELPAAIVNLTGLKVCLLQHCAPCLLSLYMEGNYL